MKSTAAMEGFNAKWKDFPDYIIGITKEIWEDRGLHTLHHYYAKDIVVRSPSGVVVGNRDVIGATLSTLAEFPDRTLYGEDVIWSGTPKEGMLSSHRLLSTATHTGAGIYGAPTGKRLTYRIIADCHARGDIIDDEWLIRDQGAIVRQLGWEPRDYAAAMLEREGDTPAPVFTPAIDKPGPYKGRGNDNAWGATYADILHKIMGAELSVIPAAYDRAAQGFYPGGATAISHPEIGQFWTGLRASFPNAAFTIEHQIGREDPMMPPRAAIRWGLHGKHDGWGAFGAPTGADVYIMGASHAEFGPWGLRREYTLFDETAVWKQILMQSDQDRRPGQHP